ncbi:MAG: polysaccharide lyase 6 family protein [Thermoproteota archaeon]
MEDFKKKIITIILGLLYITTCFMTRAINIDAFSPIQSPYPNGHKNPDFAANTGDILSVSLPISRILPHASNDALVSSISEFMNAIDEAQPGDQIILNDGKYDTSKWLDDHSSDTMLIKAKGTQDAPIIIAAETVGGVEITGPAGFEFEDSAYLVIRGFKFLHDQIEDSISIECSDCQHVRFTQNYFDLAEPNESSEWLGITGKHSEHNRIDHNTFTNKETAGNFVLILGSGGKMSRYNKIDHNYFTNHTYSSDNGGECLRIGNSAYATSNSMTTVEYNVFEKCKGDAEVISVKSSYNAIRLNVFKSNEGSVVLRHGNENQIDDNDFIQNKGGVRIYGHGHSITNNYFEGNHGDGVLQTLIIGNGTVEEDKEGSNDEYRLTEDVLVLNNTFVNNESNIVYGYGSGDLAPSNVQIDDNTASGDNDQVIEYVEKE